ncbi:hypothetical protein MNBD_DELTA03-1534 [hydrothermal vent metagenome]|uniref:Uncharacterized protein n=1 Tax=hydrothermal vent metagenome TaxID=652676 RepID=A0A3B0V7M1_9ZZZZ
MADYDFDPGDKLNFIGIQAGKFITVNAGSGYIKILSAEGRSAMF